MAAAVGLLLTGCQAIDFGNDSAFRPSSSPVTVDTVTRNDRLAGIAREQHPRILATYGGEYSDQKLERMVARIVGKVIQASDDPSQSYRVTILNSPSINAFALPGGYLYVTRGLLALASDSAELATVIAHEMGHVTANHGIQRQQKEAEEGLAAAVVNDVLGGAPAAQVALVRGKLRLAQFSRNQELEADAIGIRSAGRAGYDPYAAARFLQSMATYSDFRSSSGAEDASLDFLASHPNAPQRIELATRHARNIGQPGVGTRDREALLAGIDGMLFGDAPEEGYVRGRTFLHRGLGVSFSVPEGFTIDNSAVAVTAAGPGDVAVRFDGVTLARRTSLSDYIRSGWVSGLEEQTVQAETINGYETARAFASADGWRFEVTVIRAGSQVYRLLTAAPAASTALKPTADSVVASFKILSEAEKATLQPLRIRIVTVRPGETVGSLAARMTGVDRKMELFRLLNGLAPGAALSAGDKVKIVTDR
jgi:predicted Zn-dependent protease